MTNENLIVHTQPTTEDSFARAMAISTEREVEIDDIIENCYQITETFPEAIEAASKKLNNVNEIVYVSFHLGAFAENRRMKHNLMEKFLGE